MVNVTLSPASLQQDEAKRRSAESESRLLFVALLFKGTPRPRGMGLLAVSSLVLFLGVTASVLRSRNLSEYHAKPGEHVVICRASRWERNVSLVPLDFFLWRLPMLARA